MRPNSRARGASRAALAGYGLLVTAVLISYFLKYPIPEFLPKAAAVLSALWLAYALHAVGRGAVWLSGWLVPVTWTDSLGAWNRRLFRGAVGSGIVTFLIILLGWAVPGALATDMRYVLAGLVAASVASVALPESRRGLVPAVAPVALVLLPAAGLVVSFLSSFAPITHYDSLVYHLALPATYLREGRIESLPYNLYSAFPGACEALFTLILGALPSPEYTINVFGWAVAAAIGAAVAEWSGQIAGRRCGWVAFALWWTMPPVLLLSQGAYVDVPLAAATYLAVRSFAAWRTDPDAKSGALFAAGFCGLAISIKYTGGITAVILLAGVIFMARREARLRAIVSFVAASAVLPFPWLLKNLVSLGNPVFPFFHRWLGGNAGWTTETASGYFAVLTEYSGRSNLLVDLLTPWRTAASRGGFDVLGDFGWPLLLFAAVPACFLSSRREVRLLAAYFGLHAVAWYVSKPVLRFLVPALPVAVALSAVTLARLGRHRRPVIRTVTIALSGAWIASNVFLYGLAVGELKLFEVPFGQSSAEDFLRRRLAFYPTFQFVNESASPRETVLLVGEQRTYHLRVPFLSSNLFAPSPVSSVCNGAETLDAVSAFLHQRGVTRIIVNEGEIKRLGGLARFGFDARGEANFRAFLQTRTRHVSSDRGVDLREVEPRLSVGKVP